MDQKLIDKLNKLLMQFGREYMNYVSFNKSLSDSEGKFPIDIEMNMLLLSGGLILNQDHIDELLNDDYLHLIELMETIELAENVFLNPLKSKRKDNCQDQLSRLSSIFFLENNHTFNEEINYKSNSLRMFMSHLSVLLARRENFKIVYLLGIKFLEEVEKFPTSDYNTSSPGYLNFKNLINMLKDLPEIQDLKNKKTMNKLKRSDVIQIIERKSDELTNKDLSNLDLSGLTFEKMNLRNVNLSDSDISETKFIDSDLTDAKMENIQGFKTLFWRSNLTSVNLSNALLTPSMFREVILNNANFSNAQLTTAFLIDCKINSVNFTRADLDMTNFLNSDLTNSKFTGASIIDAKFNTSIMKNIIDFNS